MNMGPSHTDILNGRVEKILYRNSENGFTIAKLSDQSGNIHTVTGRMPDINSAESVTLKGTWGEHPKFGPQFLVSEYNKKPPTTIDGIEKYLASGLVSGIGPVMAKRIVQKYGEKSLDIIENSPHLLRKVEGIGKKRIDWIKKAWADQRDIREVMVFLQSHGIGAAFAVKIFKKYGSSSIRIIQKNPFRLASDIPGIGFVRADRIAEKLGFEKDSIVRAEAGVMYFLEKCAQEGHLYYPRNELVEKTSGLLSVSRDIILKALSILDKSGRVHIENIVEEGGAVYDSRLFHAEQSIAAHLRTLSGERELFKMERAEFPLSIIEEKLKIKLASKQREAVREASEKKAIVITGGPGTGKTTIISAILHMYIHMGKRVLLAAPTGRAAKRMSEATGHPAKTIHRLLEFSFEKGGFQRNSENPLNCDILIIDEASMIDSILMNDLMKALPSEITLILVGDSDQLPPVGPGSVLRDIIESETLPVIRLNEIFRQASESLIVVNAHRINSGMMPLKNTESRRLPDYYFIEQNNDEKILSIILRLASERIPEKFKLDPVEDVQVLTPMHKGFLGSDNLNSNLQRHLNPSSHCLSRGRREFRLRDKVMQIKNNYEKEVFNGDIGYIMDMDYEAGEVFVDFDGRMVKFTSASLDELIPAYAISVHKSQGSEYPAVILPVVTQHYIMLRRNLIYTALTRAKKLAVLVGSRKALSMAVRNNRGSRRYTGLKKYLRDGICS